MRLIGKNEAKTDVVEFQLNSNPKMKVYLQVTEFNLVDPFRNKGLVANPSRDDDCCTSKLHIH